MVALEYHTSNQTPLEQQKKGRSYVKDTGLVWHRTPGAEARIWASRGPERSWGYPSGQGAVARAAVLPTLPPGLSSPLLCCSLLLMQIAF